MDEIALHNALGAFARRASSGAASHCPGDDIAAQLITPRKSRPSAMSARAASSQLSSQLKSHFTRTIRASQPSSPPLLLDVVKTTSHASVAAMNSRATNWAR